MMATMLCVEGHELVGRELVAALDRSGWDADLVTRAAEALERIVSNRYSVALVGSTATSPLKLCRDLRGTSASLGILVLRERWHAKDRIAVLDAGTDDLFEGPGDTDE